MKVAGRRRPKAGANQQAQLAGGPVGCRVEHQVLRHGRRARIAESNTKAKPTANGRIGNSVMSCKYPQRIGLALSGHNDRLRQVSERTAEGRSGAINVNTPPATARMASIHLLRVLDWMASARAERVMASHRATRYANPAPRDRPSLTGANEIYGPAPDDARLNCAATKSSAPATARSNVRRERSVIRPNLRLIRLRGFSRRSP